MFVGFGQFDSLLFGSFLGLLAFTLELLVVGCQPDYIPFESSVGSSQFAGLLLESRFGLLASVLELLVVSRQLGDILFELFVGNDQFGLQLSVDSSQL